jgi:hypothetical protein
MSKYSELSKRLEKIKKEIAKQTNQQIMHRSLLGTSSSNGISKIEIRSAVEKTNRKGINFKKHENSERNGSDRSLNIERYMELNWNKELINLKKDVLDEKLGFPNYINVINSFRNPDVMTGDALKFLKGNKYRAKMVDRDEDQKREQEKIVKEKQDADSQTDVQPNEEESSGEPEIPSRYYHNDSKSIRCKNWKEIGHMIRNCPNESKVPLWKFWGKAHGRDDNWPSIKWFKWNKSGHKIQDCKAKNIVIWEKWKSIGHTKERWLMTPFKGKQKYALWVVCSKPGHLNWEKLERKEFHIDFDEEEVENSDDDNLFSVYKISDFLKDEKKFLRKQSLDSSASSYQEVDEISTNLVTSKQMKHIKKHSSKKQKVPRHLKKFYTFPMEDREWTESQVGVMYCGNWGRRGHQFLEWSYEDNNMYIDYQRKTFRRDKANKEQINKSNHYSDRAFKKFGSPNKHSRSDRRYSGRDMNYRSDSDKGDYSKGKRKESRRGKHEPKSSKKDRYNDQNSSKFRENNQNDKYRWNQDRESNKHTWRDGKESKNGHEEDSGRHGELFRRFEDKLKPKDKNSSSKISILERVKKHVNDEFGKQEIKRKEKRLKKREQKEIQKKYSSRDFLAVEGKYRR